MAITLPDHYIYTQEQNSATFNENIDEDSLLALRDNGHYLYAHGALKNAVGHYWHNGITTTVFATDGGETVLSLPFRHTHIRGAEVGLRVLYEAIGEVEVSVFVSTLAGSSLGGIYDQPISDGIAGSWTIADGWADQTIKISVTIAVQDGESAPAGLRYLLITELPLDLGNLP